MLHTLKPLATMIYPHTHNISCNVSKKKMCRKWQMTHQLMFSLFPEGFHLLDMGVCLSFELNCEVGLIYV